MKILFLHGLESKLNDEKRKVLEQYGEIIAPSMDYSNDSQIIETVFRKYENADIDAIIGSSMGGFTGFYLAARLGKPALLFNPALPYRTVVQDVPEEPIQFSNRVHIVLGKFDPIIKYSDTKDFLRQNQLEEQVNVILREDFEHRVPKNILEEEASNFFSEVGQGQSPEKIHDPS